MMISSNSSILNQLLSYISSIRKSCYKNMKSFQFQTPSILFVYKNEEESMQLAYLSSDGSSHSISQNLTLQLSDPQVFDIVLSQFPIILVDINCIVRIFCFVSYRMIGLLVIYQHQIYYVWLINQV